MNGIIKGLLKLVFWGAAALAALCGGIVALQKLGVLPQDVTLGTDQVSLRVRIGEDAEEDSGIDDELI